MQFMPEAGQSWNWKKRFLGAVITDFKGGATVNAIAGDAAFKVNTAMCKTSEADNKASIEKAVKDGVDKENAFRGVKAGDLVKGFPAEIQFKIK